MRGTRLPIDVLRATYDEVVAAGSQRAVAKAHGWPQSKVKHRVESYMATSGIEGPPPGIISAEHSHRATLSHSGQGDRSAWRRDQARLRDAQAALERALVENRKLRERVDDLAEKVDRWDRLEAKLDALLARPLAIGSVTHRRIKDGGVGGREELRSLRRTA